ncbi:hypothetical protein L0Y47_16020 [Ectopseudomonas composti]
MNRDSWVVYKEAVVMQCDRLVYKLASGEVRGHQTVTDELFANVRAGFDVSKMVPQKIKRFIRAHSI